MLVLGSIIVFLGLLLIFGVVVSAIVDIKRDQRIENSVNLEGVEQKQVIDTCPHLYTSEEFISYTFHCPSLDLDPFFIYKDIKEQDLVYRYNLLNEERCKACDYWSMTPEEASESIIKIKNYRAAETNKITSIRNEPSTYKEKLDQKEVDRKG